LEVFQGAKKLLENIRIEKIIFELSTGVMSGLDWNPIESLKLLESFQNNIKNYK